MSQLMKLFGFTVALATMLAHPSAVATNFDVSHLAAELNRVSSELALELRNTRGYGSVRFSADRLSREAAQLVTAISRNRSLSYQRAQFQDVARHYRELEEAFLRSSREHNRYVYNKVGVISNLFSGLNSEFHYTNYVEPAPLRYSYVPPSYSRYGRAPIVSGRSPASPGRSTRGVETPSVGRSSGSRTILLPPRNFSHRSPVLERQQRQQMQRSNVNSIIQSRRIQP